MHAVVDGRKHELRMIATQQLTSARRQYMLWVNQAPAGCKSIRLMSCEAQCSSKLQELTSVVLFPVRQLPGDHDTQ